MLHLYSIQFRIYNHMPYIHSWEAFQNILHHTHSIRNHDNHHHKDNQYRCIHLDDLPYGLHTQLWRHDWNISQISC